MHIYDKDGNPQHFQTIKSGDRKGELRPSTIRDWKANRDKGWKPSVTEINGAMDDGGGLTRFLIKQAVEEATNPDFVKRDYAAEGEVIHKYVENWVTNGIMTDESKPFIEAAEKFFGEVGIASPVSEERFVTDYEGGTVDLHDKQANIVADIKTKDFDSFVDAKKLVYDKYVMQLTAYRDGLKMPNARLINLFLSRTTPGLYCWYEHSPAECARGAAMYYHCRELWYLKNT